MTVKTKSGISGMIQELEDSGLVRTVVDAHPLGNGRVRVQGRELVDFCSNDTLGLALDPRLTECLSNAAVQGAGSRATRLLSGSREAFGRLEERFAALVGKPAALLFNSGYHANTGLLPVLTTDKSVIFSDQLNHASIVDGCRLAPAETSVFPHNDVDALEQILRQMELVGTFDRSQVNVLVVEALFSMDGDAPDVARLIRLKKEFDLLLYVDDAHGFGAWGKGGLGAFADHLDDVDVYMATFGKALGVMGACAAATNEIVKLARSRARSFIFSTALPPPLVETVSTSMDLVFSAEGERLRRELQDNVGQLCAVLDSGGVRPLSSGSHIVPVELGDEAFAAQAARELVGSGVYARAIRYPTVELGRARLRLAVTAAHRPEDLEAAAKAIVEAVSKE